MFNYKLISDYVLLKIFLIQVLVYVCGLQNSITIIFLKLCVQKGM